MVLFSCTAMRPARRAARALRRIGTITGPLVVSFAAWGINDVFRTTVPDTVAKVGGTEISKEEFERAVPDLVKIAFDDPSWLSNPRMPLVSELEELFWSAYQGRGLAKVASASLQQIS